MGASYPKPTRPLRPLRPSTLRPGASFWLPGFPYTHKVFYPLIPRGISWAMSSHASLHHGTDDSWATSGPDQRRGRGKLEVL